MPFVLWLMGGLVPWFYFQEALNGGTGVLDEYSYLVKKVVFQIDALPVVKLISALFTHAFLWYLCWLFLPLWDFIRIFMCFRWFIIRFAW